MEPNQLLGRFARWMLLVGAALFVSLWIVLAGARPALASCTTSSGPCTAVVSLTDDRFDRHNVPFSTASSADATADSPLSVQRSWMFAVRNSGPATVVASYNATSPLTFFYPVNPGPPPPPFSASGTLAMNQGLRNPAQEIDFALDTQAPGFSSSRSVSPLVIPMGGATQTVTVTFTLDDSAYNVPVVVLLGDPGMGSTWQLTGSSDPANTTPAQPYPAPATPSSFVRVGVTATVGTTYTLTFTGFVPNSLGRIINFKPGLMIESAAPVNEPAVYDSAFSLCDTVLNAGPCTSANNVTYTFDQAYELRPLVEHTSQLVYVGGHNYQVTYGAALTPGYWKNHLTTGTPNTSQFLPQAIGPYTVSNTSQVTSIFNAMNCGNSTAQNAIGCLAGQDLATLLNVANGSDDCITADLMKANAWLSAITEDGVPGITYTGPTSTYSLTSDQRSEAIALMNQLSMYNAGGEC
jgi:hypothetical protein